MTYARSVLVIHNIAHQVRLFFVTYLLCPMYWILLVAVIGNIAITNIYCAFFVPIVGGSCLGFCLAFPNLISTKGFIVVVVNGKLYTPFEGVGIVRYMYNRLYIA